MKHVWLAMAVFLGAAPAVSAQTEGRISVGGSVTSNLTTDGEVGSATTFGPLVRLNPRKGWRATGAFNWFRAELNDPAGGSGDFARLRVRPLMGGVSYTIGGGKLLTSFSIVAGPSFNRVEFDRDFTHAAAAAIDVDNSFAVRPGIGLTYTVAPRVGVVGFGGYLVNRPGLVYRDSVGNEFRDRWKADAIVLSIGVVYSIF